MANVWENVDIIAAEALSVLMDNLVITRLAARDKTADFMVRPNGYAVGDTVRIKTRPDYTVDEFSGTATAQSIRSSTRTMAIEKWYDVSVAMTSREKALELDSLVEEVIQPAVIRLAEKVDLYVGTKILKARGAYISSDLLASAADVALARAAADYQQLNPAGRFALVDSSLEAKLLGQTWFNQSQTRGDPGVTTLQSGIMGRVMGIDWYSSLNFPSSSATPGDAGATTNNGSGGNTNNQIGATTLTVDAADGGEVKVGDRLLIAGVRRPLIVGTALDPVTTAIALAHPIDQIIPDNAAVTIVGDGQTLAYKGAIFDTDALAVAMPMLDSPSDKPSYVIASEGISIRVVQGYDMATKTDTLSLDLIVGAEAYDPRRITLLADY